jgi:hypothetical protein
MPHPDLIKALAGPSTADVVANYQPPPEPSWHDKYVKPWGSAALAKAEPNWFGKNVLAKLQAKLEKEASAGAQG